MRWAGGRGGRRHSGRRVARSGRRRGLGSGWRSRVRFARVRSVRSEGRPSGTMPRDIFRRALCVRRGDRSAGSCVRRKREWDDVPQIFGDDPGDEEIDFVASVGGLPSGGFDAIARLGVALGGFDLNAPEIAVSGVEEKVVALAVSPRLGDAEAQAGGFGEKSGLGGFSATLAGGEADSVDVEFEDGFIFRYAGWGSHNKKAQRVGCADGRSYVKNAAHGRVSYIIFN